MADAPHTAHDDEGESGPIGIFPSWKALYWSVVIYTVGLIALLALFTRIFDFSVR